MFAALPSIGLVPMATGVAAVIAAAAIGEEALAAGLQTKEYAATPSVLELMTTVLPPGLQSREYDRLVRYRLQ